VPKRSTVTILFCDIVGSTALLNQIGEDANDELRRDVFSVLRGPIAALGGQEVKTQGDGMMVAFEGRATDAVACAVAWQQAIDALARRDPSLRLAIRVGVSTGEATAEENDWFGTPVVEAARLCDAAGTSQILVSEAVRLVADEAGVEFVPAGRIELKGFPEPRAAYAVPWTPVAPASIVPRPPRLDTTGAAPFAGRITERRRLFDAIDAATRRTVFVAGPAGIGKTRLVAEAVRDLEGVAVLAGDAGGPGRYAASAEALRWYVVAAPTDALRRVLGADAGLLAGFVPAITVRLPEVAPMETGAGDEPETDAVLEAFVGAFERLAAEGELVVVVDDLHLASGPELALFLELATRTGLDNLTLIGGFRTDDHGHVAPALTTVLDKLDRVGDVERIDLGPLAAADIATVAGPVPIDVAAVESITGGNPAQIVDAVRRLAVDDDPTRALSVAFPFKGLVTFRAEDAPLFFGRDDAIGTLLGRLAHDRFAAVVGTSGSGKSSLVRAGLLPALAGGRLPGDWPSVTCTPGAHPEAALRAALSGSPAARVVFVDQLEECVTQCTDADERTRFLDELTALATNRERDTRVVVTVRADLLGAVAVVSPAFAALLEAGALFLGPMNDGELRAVVEGPAAVAGLRLEPGLVDVVVRDVSGEPGALPLLSHALLETWKRRRGNTLTIANYDEAGGAQRAIAHSADVLFESLDASHQALARNLFVSLTELGEGTEDSRRRLSAVDLAALGSAGDVQSLVDALVAARLITVDEGSVEVAHEALIREWPRLREWLDESRDELRLQREVLRRAEEWNRLGRPEAELLRGARLEQALTAAVSTPLEQEYLDAGRALREREASDTAQRVRRLRSLLATAVVLLLVAAVAGVVARTQSNRANDRATEAREQSELADVQRISAEAVATSTGNLRVALPLAVEGFRLDNRYETRNALLSALQTEPALLGYLAAPKTGYDAVAIAPNGKTSVFASLGGLDVWRLVTRERQRTLPIENPLAVAFLDNNRMAVATADDVQVWNIEGSKPLRTIAQPAADIAVLGRRIVIGGPTGEVVLVDPTSGRVLARSSHGTQPVHVAASRNGVLVTAGSAPAPGFNPPFRISSVRRDPRTLEPQGVPREGSAALVSDLAVSPNGTAMAVANEEGPPEVIPLDDVRRTFSPSDADAYTAPSEAAQVVFLDENTAISAGSTGRTYTWNTVRADRGINIPSFATQFGAARDLVVTPDGSALWAAGAGAVGWSLVGDDSLGGDATGDSLTPVALSADGTRLLANADINIESEQPLAPADPNAPQVGTALAVSRTTQVLDAATMTKIGRPYDGIGLGFLPDGKHFVASAVGGIDGVMPATVVVVDIATGRARTILPPPFANPVLSPDGSRLALSQLDGTVSLVDAATGDTRVKGLGIAGRERPDVIAFGPQNAIAIQYPKAGKIVIIDGETTRTIDIGRDVGGAIAFHPDGTLLAVGGTDGNVRLYDRETGTVDGAWFVGHTGRVNAIEYDRSGTLLASTAADLTTRVFDVEQRRPYGRPFASTGSGLRFFDDDGQRLFNATTAGVVVTSLDPGDWADRACARAGANMTTFAWSLYLPGRTPVATCAQYPPPE
jgi:class 3 adenylate cyclase/WD40 repeat protein